LQRRQSIYLVGRWPGRSKFKQIPYGTVYLQVLTYVGQVRQEQVQKDPLLQCLPSGGNLWPGAPGEPGTGADRSLFTMLTCRWRLVWSRCTRWARSRCRRIPITLFTFRWQPVWGRCTRWARSRCRRTTCRLSSTSPASPSGSPPGESPSRYIAYMPLPLALLSVLSVSLLSLLFPYSPFSNYLSFF
jgi:hypothetical protein